VPAATQQDQVRLRQDRLGQQALAGTEQAVTSAPADRHRHTGGNAAGERYRCSQDRVDRAASREEGRKIATGLLRCDLGGPVDDRGVDEGSARDGACQRRAQRLRQFPGHLHYPADGPGVGQLSLVCPESCWGQSRHAGGAATLGCLECKPTSHGAPGQVRALQAQLVEESDELCDQGFAYPSSVSLAVGAERRRLTVTRQVNEDYLTMRRQPPEDCVPGLAAMPDPVQQHQWFARPDPLVGQSHKKHLPPGAPPAIPIHIVSTVPVAPADQVRPAGHAWPTAPGEKWAGKWKHEPLRWHPRAVRAFTPKVARTQWRLITAAAASLMSAICHGVPVEHTAQGGRTRPVFGPPVGPVGRLSWPLPVMVRSAF
jgi:hypothetical protein